MSSTIPSNTVYLHPRACTCSRCQPWVQQQSTLAMPSQQIILGVDHWIALGRPMCIDDLMEAQAKQSGTDRRTP